MYPTETRANAMWRRVPRSKEPGWAWQGDPQPNTAALALRSVAVCRLPAAEWKAKDGHEWPLGTGAETGRQAGACPVIQENIAAAVCKAGRTGVRTIPENTPGPSRLSGNRGLTTRKR